MRAANAKRAANAILAELAELRLKVDVIENCQYNLLDLVEEVCACESLFFALLALCEILLSPLHPHFYRTASAAIRSSRTSELLPTSLSSRPVIRFCLFVTADTCNHCAQHFVCECPSPFFYPRQAVGDVDAILSRYYELSDVAEAFPEAFLGPRIIEAKAGDKIYMLAVGGCETGGDLWKMLLDRGFSKDPSRCRLLYDHKDISEFDTSLDHLEIPDGAVIAVVDRFDFELKLCGGVGGRDQDFPETSLKLP